MKKIRIITGTGRSGTTALVRLMARMGVTSIANTYYNTAVNGGNEVVLSNRMNSLTLMTLPPVIKDPRLLFTMGRVLETNPELEILHSWLCVRDVDDVIASRAAYGMTWEPEEDEDPRAFLLRGMGNHLNDCATYMVPVTVLRYPDFLQDKWGLFVAIMNGIGDVKENKALRDKYSKAYEEEINPDLIGAYLYKDGSLVRGGSEEKDNE